jgi:hypothetical protein
MKRLVALSGYTDAEKGALMQGMMASSFQHRPNISNTSEEVLKS